MNREDALRLLRDGADGVREWNRLAAAGEASADLRDAFLINAELRGIDLRGALLVGACLRQADLREADLTGAQLNGADLRGANLRGANLRHANLSKAVFGGTLIACDLSRAMGLDTTVHISRSIVDVLTVLQFRGRIPEAFLRGCGMPEEEIAHFGKRVRSETALAGCFICHGAGDQTFAARLHDDFQAVGLRCWKWNYDTQFCEQLLGDPDLAVAAMERILLIAGRSALLNESVNLEIGRIIEEEARRDSSARPDDGPAATELLLVVRTDDFIFQTSADGRPLWEHPHREAVTRRTIVDAVGWDRKPGRYKEVHRALLQALTSA